MSAQLNFVVENQSIRRTDNFKVVARSQNYLNASFTFSSDWGNDEKIAIFKSGCNSYEIYIDSNGECAVPWESLTSPGNLFVSVYSGDRITTNMARVRVFQTGYTERVSSTAEPTVDVYQSLLARMNTIDEHIAEEVSSAIFTPDVTEDGTLTWSNEAGLPNPISINIPQLVEGMYIVPVSGTDPVIVAETNHRYVCGEVYTISITAPEQGISNVVFTSGSTVPILTATGITFPDWFDATSLEADTLYEISISDGRAVIATWGIS